MDLCVMIEAHGRGDRGERADRCPRIEHLALVGALAQREVVVGAEEGGDAVRLAGGGERPPLVPADVLLALGTLVSPATFRHPSVLAKLAVTADHVSGGRIEVGLGAGWNDAEHAAFGFPFADLVTRVSVFAEQLEIVRGLTDATPFELAGQHYRVGPVQALPKPVQERLPIIVGGNAAPRSAAVAARFADEYNTPLPPPEEIAPRRAAVARAWSEAGRDPDSVRFSVMTGLLVGRDDDELLDRAGCLAAKLGDGRSAREELDALPPSWIAGTVDDVVEQLRALAELGVDRVMLQLLLHDDLDQVALIGGELAGAVR